MAGTLFGLDLHGLRRGRTEKLDLPVPRHGQRGALFVRNPEYSFQWMSKDPVFWLLERLHPSPTAKFDALYHKLLVDSKSIARDFTRSLYLDEEDFLRVHTPKYLEHLERVAERFFGYGGLLSTMGRVDYTPTVPKVLDFAKASCAGTYHAARLAQEQGFAMNLSGGFHHAFADHEEGYCHLNDVAIAIRRLQVEGRIKKAMIVDCDVHNGNGNATIFQNDPAVKILDMYQEDNNYPLIKVPGAWPIPLSSERPVDDNLYLGELKQTLDRALQSFQPDIIFYLAGADPHEGDRLGGFKVTHAGLEYRDRYVLAMGCNNSIPVVVVTAGGYGNKLENVVQVHYNTAIAVRDFAKHTDRARAFSADVAGLSTRT